MNPATDNVPDPDQAERDRCAECEGKSIFIDWPEAFRVAKRMRRRAHDRGSGEWFEPYRCSAGHIHIGCRDRSRNRINRASRRRRRNRKAKR